MAYILPNGTLAGLSNETTDRCTAAGGTCIDTDTETCNGKLLTGYCPGGSNIRCCVPKTAPPTMPGSTSTAPPPGVTTAGFPWWMWLLVAGGAYYFAKNT